jgi:hypothetical protein
VSVTSHPSSEWVVQQLREAFPEEGHIDTSSWITTRSLRGPGVVNLDFGLFRNFR